jgi:hypothetical protein
VSKAKKPSSSAIMRAGYLTEYSQRPADPLSRCNLCTEDCFSNPLIAYREHDEHDWPMPGNERLLFLGYEHEECERKMLAHARLYEPDAGAPGAFPRLCGPCAFRNGLACAHPALKANGGQGLRVVLEGGGITLCTRDNGCFRSPQSATKCDGFRPGHLRVVADAEAEPIP